MAFKIVESLGPRGKIAGSTASAQDIESTSTTQNFALGTRVRAVDPTYGEAEFIYAKGVASTAKYDAVVILGDHTTARTGARSKGLLGVAMSANVANQYGWYCIWGKVPVKAGTVVAAAPAYLTATAAQLDDAIVAGDFVAGASFVTADGTPSAGLAVISLFYSVVTDADNA
jgi:hypothetical protein